MRRTMIIGAVSATALTIGLGVGATLAASEPTPPAPTAPVTMTDAMTNMMDANGMSNMMNAEGMTSMMDANGMTSMMDANGMATMMDANGMDAMHTTMHQALEGSVPADVLAACDDVHASMSNAQAPWSTDLASNHAAHHPGSQP